MVREDARLSKGHCDFLSTLIKMCLWSWQLERNFMKGLSKAGDKRKNKVESEMQIKKDIGA